MSSPSILARSLTIAVAGAFCLRASSDVVVRGRDRPGGHGLLGGVLLLPVPGAAGHRLPLRQAAQEGGREDQEDHPEAMAQEKAVVVKGSRVVEAGRPAGRGRQLRSGVWDRRGGGRRRRRRQRQRLEREVLRCRRR